MEAPFLPSAADQQQQAHWGHNAGGRGFRWFGGNKPDPLVGLTIPFGTIIGEKV